MLSIPREAHHLKAEDCVVLPSRLSAFSSRGTYKDVGTSQDANKVPTKFHMKKNLKLKRLKGKGKNKGSNF
ncbi:hypothetical protein PTKIN_Ptkin09bG0184600 [Pterospermum kingtungense]